MTTNLPIGNVLFFGCRSKSSDYFFELEWNTLCSQGYLKLFTAFSRDQVIYVIICCLCIMVGTIGTKTLCSTRHCTTNSINL